MKDTLYTVLGSGITHCETVSSITELIDLLYSSIPESSESLEEKEYIKFLFTPITKEEFYEGLK